MHKFKKPYCGHKRSSDDYFFKNLKEYLEKPKIFNVLTNQNNELYIIHRNNAMITFKIMLINIYNIMNECFDKFFQEKNIRNYMDFYYNLLDDKDHSGIVEKAKNNNASSEIAKRNLEIYFLLNDVFSGKICLPIKSTDIKSSGDFDVGYINHKKNINKKTDILNYYTELDFIKSCEYNESIYNCINLCENNDNNINIIFKKYIDDIGKNIRYFFYDKLDYKYFSKNQFNEQIKKYYSPVNTNLHYIFYTVEDNLIDFNEPLFIKNDQKIMAIDTTTTNYCVDIKLPEIFRIMKTKIEKKIEIKDNIIVLKQYKCVKNLINNTDYFILFCAKFPKLYPLPPYLNFTYSIESNNNIYSNGNIYRAPEIINGKYW